MSEAEVLHTQDAGLDLGWMRRQAGEYHPPVGDTPLDSRRRRYAVAMLLIFLLIATPVPFRPAL